jgi:hypothetical protein
LVSKSIVLLFCKKTQVLTIYRRSVLEVIYTKEFSGVDEVELLQVQDGLVTYIFYSVEKKNNIGMIEVFVDERIATKK